MQGKDTYQCHARACVCPHVFACALQAPGKRGAKRAPAKRAPRKNKKQHKEQQEQSEVTLMACYTLSALAHILHTRSCMRSLHTGAPAFMCMRMCVCMCE